MSKITICTAVWKRPEVFEIFLNSWLALDPVPSIFVMGSLEDECAELANQYGCYYMRVSNEKVGYKWNLAHIAAANFQQVNYFLTTASDDVMDQNMWTYYNNFEGERLCLSDLYFYDTVSKKAIYWRGYQNKQRLGHPIGAHQIHRRDVLEKMNWKPFNDNAMGNEADTHTKCIALGIQTTCVKMHETGGIGIDIKSKDSYSKFRLWPNSVPYAVEKLVEKSSELMKIIL